MSDWRASFDIDNYGNDMATYREGVRDEEPDWKDDDEYHGDNWWDEETGDR